MVGGAVTFAAIITRKRDNVLDGFYGTNGMFYPAPNKDLEIPKSD